MQEIFLQVGLLIVVLHVIVTPSDSCAQTPALNHEQRGWYRMHLGKFEITALVDGTLDLPLDDFFTEMDVDSPRLQLLRKYLPHKVTITVNAFLINEGTKLILIDAGMGTLQRYGNKLGALLTNLKASGYLPEQVDEIYITHMHADHIGGLVRNGLPVFINASVRADSHEADFYLTRSKIGSATPDEQEDIRDAVSIFRPYIAADKFKPFTGKTELIPGITAVPTPGHTSGHLLYVIESQGKKMVVCGDLLHIATLQFALPTATLKTDWDTTQSVQQRLINFADAANNGYYVAATHIAFPGIGKLRATGAGYTWIPVSSTFHQ